MGPGKYDAECTYVRVRTGAQVCMVIVMGGIEGAGFAVQMVEEAQPVMKRALPQVLRDMARQIERDLRGY